MNIQQLAKALNVRATATITRNWIAKGYGPPHKITDSGAIEFPVSGPGGLTQWMEKQRVYPERTTKGLVV